jgi:DNA-binding transcriptional LysR family regulator
MEFDQLRALLAIVEHGSFTRAGEALGISQSTVSFQLKALETSVGAKLLDRGWDGVQPTAPGRILLRYAERIVSLRREAIEALSAEAKGLQGHVVVAASTIPGEYLLPQVLSVLRATHPGVSVTLEVSDTGSALASLAAGRCDLALVGQRPNDRRLVARAFASDDVILVGTPRANGVDATDASILREVPLVLRKDSSGTRAAVAELLSQHPPTGARVTVGSTEAAKRCALQGLGLAFVSRVSVAGEVERGELREVKLVGLPVSRRFWLATPRRTTLSSSASALVELLGTVDDE